MRLNIDCEIGEMPIGLEDLLNRVMAACLKVEGVPENCAANMLITDDATIHEINREQRGVDRATDVLSFPSIQYPAGTTARDRHTTAQAGIRPGCGRIIFRRHSDFTGARARAGARVWAQCGAGDRVFNRALALSPDGLRSHG